MSNTPAQTISPTDRLLAIEDIKATCSRYALGLDTFDMELLLSAFAEDIIFDASPFGLGTFEGHDALRGFFQHNFEVMKSQMHLFANFIVDVDGPDTATGTNYLLEEGYSNEGALIRCLCRDEDRYIRTDAGWRIVGRVIHPLVEPKLEGYQEGL